MSKKNLNNPRKNTFFFGKLIHTDDSVENLKFYILSFNILCNISKTEYIPVEIGIAKYSIKLGIEDSFHSFINPGPVPKGYMGISKDISESTHKIPIIEFDLADRDYAKTYQSILKFINPKVEIVAFCIDEEIQQNKSCFEWLHKKSKSEDDFPIQIYNVASLLMKLSEYGNLPFPSEAMASNALNCHAFDYISNTRCNFHEDLDNDFCALGRTKRLCFILSKNLCKLFKVCPTDNHIPPKKTNYQAQPLNLPTVSTFTRTPRNWFQNNQVKKINDEKQSYQNINGNYQKSHPREDLFKHDAEQSKPFSNKVSPTITTNTANKTQLSAESFEKSDLNTICRQNNSGDRSSRQPFSFPRVLMDDPQFRSFYDMSNLSMLRQPNSVPLVLRDKFENFPYNPARGKKE